MAEPLPKFFRRYVKLAILGALISIAAITIHTYRSFDLPSKDQMMQMHAAGLTLLDREGQEFFKFDAAGRRTIIPLSDIPDHVVQALIAAEDKDFFHHPGFSPLDTARAAYHDLQARQLMYGGSTLTQQLAKSLLVNPQKSLARKYKELIVALKIEYHFSKTDILDVYLNTAYFGRGAHGLEEAAKTYFDKSARDLTLAEGSFLIGLLPAPTTFAPTTDDMTLAKIRQTYVLTRLVQEAYISPAAKDTLVAEPLSLIDYRPPTNQTAPHFALLVRKQLLTKYTPEYLVRSGLRVTTTLDTDWQTYAETAVADHMTALTSSQANNGAAVIIDPISREVRALVGSRSWHHPGFGKVNMATQPRQTGSAFKPVVYAAGLEQRTLTAASLLRDYPVTFGQDYRPKNYDGRYHGQVLARYALANSLNIPAVDAVSQIGPAATAAMAKQLGINTLSEDAPYNLSIALGTESVSLLELTNTYATFAAEGRYAPPQTILSIEDKFGQPVDWSEPAAESRVSKETAFIISSMLSDTRSRIQTFGQALTISQPAAVKTGTTQDYRDAWTVGYTPALTIGVWIGNNDNTPMNRLAGSLGAAPLWRNLMENSLRTLPTLAFQAPAGVVQVSICPHRGLRAVSPGSGIPEYFIAGTEPTRPCPALPPPETELSEEAKQAQKDQEKAARKKEQADKRKARLREREEREQAREEDEEVTIVDQPDTNT